MNIRPAPDDSALMALVRAIVGEDAATASRLFAASPALATACFAEGASRTAAKTYFVDEIGRYIYAGDTALHIAAAAYRTEIAKKLIAAGANVRARNRRGAEPLHAAAAGAPSSSHWNPPAQAATIACLVSAGANPHAMDANGAMPLHIAVRARCAAAVVALLAAGADARRRNKSGSTPMLLATQNTGRGGTGSPEAKAQQNEIVRMLAQRK